MCPVKGLILNPSTCFDIQHVEARWVKLQGVPRDGAHEGVDTNVGSPLIDTPIRIIRSGNQLRRAQRRFRVLGREGVAPGKSQGCQRFPRDLGQTRPRRFDAGWVVSGWSGVLVGRWSTWSWSAKRR